MLFAVLLIWKILLFMDITNIKYNESVIILTSILITSLLFSIIYLSKLKNKRTLGFSLYIIISSIMFVDVMYYSYFNSLPSISMIKQFNQLGAVGDSIKTLLNPRNLMFILDIPFHFI
ncbi:hypothetical protein, partial [Schnuerera sp.]|uniref:hypothetical protein n=1 Tax=Schnuerera sp. TaxID=2794844 RepID=UPI002C943A6D